MRSRRRAAARGAVGGINNDAPPLPTMAEGWGFDGDRRSVVLMMRRLFWRAYAQEAAEFVPFPPQPIPGPPLSIAQLNRISQVPVPTTPIVDPRREFLLTPSWYRFFLSLPPSEKYIFLGNQQEFELPKGSRTGDRIGIKDNAGNAGTFPRTIVGDIDGGSFFVMNENYQSVEFVWDGTKWMSFRGS
jgi:hypothetical protein